MFIYTYIHIIIKYFEGIAVLLTNVLTSLSSYVLCLVNVYDVLMCVHTYESQRPLCLSLVFAINSSDVGSLTDPQIHYFRNAGKPVSS